MYNGFTLLHSRNEHILNQLYTKKNENNNKASPLIFTWSNLFRGKQNHKLL